MDNSQKTKMRIVKTVDSTAATYGCETWTIREAEKEKLIAFELWCWRRMLDRKAYKRVSVEATRRLANAGIQDL